MPPRSDTSEATAKPGDSGDEAATELTLSADGPTGTSAPGLTRGAALARYVILDELGRGATGIVYSAFDPDLDRKVALKVLRRNQEPRARSRLLREAQAMARLSHANVVTVYEVGTDDGRDYVSMECVEGGNLDDWRKNPREHEEILAVYRQAGRGLAAAHRAGLVHRDFKPHNVLIDDEARVLVTDFGLSRQSGDTEGEGDERRNASSDSEVERPDAGDLTRTGAVLGTPAYMAPEQHRAQAADSRSDQYSFCVALYEALAGHRPFDATEYAALKEQVLSDKPAALPDGVEVSPRVRAALARGLSKDAELRFASMDELLAELETAPARRWPLYLGGAALAMALAVLLLVMSGTASANQCKPDPRVLAGSWDPEVKKRVHLAFAMTGVEGATDVLNKFEKLVDSYAAQLVGLRVQICEASQSQNARDDQLMLMQMTCLQKRRQELQALTSAFANVDARGVDRALEATLALTPIAECQDAASLQRGVARPAAEAREEVSALQASLQEAKSQGEAGRGKSAIVVAETVRDRSLALGYLPLQAEAQAVLGQLYFAELRLADAERAYDEAILAAEESGYTEYRARALAGMTRLVASGSSRYHEARRLARRARAAISQLGGNAELTVDVDLAMAVILQQEGRLQEALSLLEATWRSVRGHDKTTALQVARLQNRIAAIKSETGDYDEAHRLAASSYDLVRAELGDNNSRSIEYLSTLASTLRMRGDNEEAQSLDARLRAYWASDKARPLLLEADEYLEATRPIRGRVLGPEKQPVAGATVVCSERVLADTRYLDVAWNAHRDAIYHYARVTSGADGAFTCEQASTEALVVVADDARTGRSSAIEIAASEEPREGLELTLSATGFLSGTVLKDGKPAAAQAVTAVPMQANVAQPSFAALTFLRPDGSYSFERLAPGTYKVFSGPRDSTASSVLHSQDVQIVSGSGATLDFDQSEGDAGLKVVVKGLRGVEIPSAQVLLVPGHIESQTGGEFNASVVATSADVRSYFWSAGDTLEVDDLKAGLHSLCVVPLGGDYRDPEYMGRFDKEVLDAIPVHCRDVEVASDEVLEVEVEVEAFRLAPKVEPPVAPPAGSKG